ncbi:very-long-chain (3R)-3-hydroxyacyl-CoA dehydratase-like [Ostrinia furnacalis]|uniref:very-long-chain (3R)-3-hydroxyacyl-CoA dehydratase-like n=1 Tax=Ostrinia furnacalis TaxID=93504 RepID=UPI00103B7C0B|nr:very-long-chain (3R)-3-hydroxyacyl-CoA dehydratase-like [Ostrinia furnacalis]
METEKQTEQPTVQPTVQQSEKKTVKKKKTKISKWFIFIKLYLTLYNFFQFLGYSYVILVILFKFVTQGHVLYENVGPIIKVLQLLQFLEVLNPLIGLTRGIPFVPFLQIFGRAVVLFWNVDIEPRIQAKPVVIYLIIIWSLVETVRYPFYLTQIYGKDVNMITWLRYTLWIPLYPAGFLCEYLIIYSNIPYFEETNKLSVTMPNEWNFAFHMPTFSRIHICLLMAAGMYLMKHMHRVRMARLQVLEELKVK